jgi:hypothetical protein
MAITNNMVLTKSVNLVEDKGMGFPYTDTRGSTHNFYNCEKPGSKSQIDIIKWCRRNFGARGVGWDFTTLGKNVIITINDEKFKTMYELWHR